MIDRLSGFFKKRPDRYLAAGGVLFGILVFFFLGVKAPDYRGTGIMLCVACIIYLALAWRQDVSFEFPSIPARFTAPILNILFLGLFSYSLLVLHFNTGGRPLGYFISIALMSTLVALEAVTTPQEAKGRNALILGKILFISLSLRWSLFYVYPGSYLGTDPWRNAAVYNQIIDAGHILPEIGGYFYMPVQHLVVTATAQVTGLAVREASMLSIGLFEGLSLIFIFLLGRKIYNTKIGLLAALLLAVNNLHIMWGWWIVAQTAGIALVSLVSFLVFTPQTYGKVVYRALTIIALIILIITHSVSAFVVLVILSIAWAGTVVYGWVSKNRQSSSPGNVLIFFSVALIGYWLYITNFFPEYLRIIWGTGPEFSATISYTPSLVARVNPAWSDLNRLGNLLFYGFATIGLLSTLNPRNINISRFILVFCGILLTSLIYLVFTVLNVEMMIGRWFVFMDILLAVPAAIGLLLLANGLSASWVKLGVLALTSFLLAFLMITNATASFDSPIYPIYLKDRTALTVSEMNAADTIASVYPGQIVMDSAYSLSLTEKPGVRVTILSSQDVQNHFTDIVGLLVLRKYAVDNVFLAMVDQGIYKVKMSYDPYQALESQGFNRVYDNGSVGGYSR
jgi:hypothetical protein